MHVDHVVYAVGPAGLTAEAERFEQELGVKSRDGGIHPRFGTQMRLIPLTDQRYIEIVEVLDHPAADKAPYGQAVRARQELGGGWLGWVISVDDLGPYETRLERQASDEEVLPSALHGEVSLTKLEIAGNRHRVADWLGAEVPDTFDGVAIAFTSQSGYPGLDAVTFRTANGDVRI